MTDKIGKYDNKWWKSISGIGMIGRRVSDWCSPPVGPPESFKNKALPSTVDGKARMEGIPNPWFTGPPKIKEECGCCESTIVKLPKKHFIEEELDTFEKWLKEAEPWSLEKTHLMTIVAEIACTEKLPLKYRTRASALIRSNVDDPILATAVT